MTMFEGEPSLFNILLKKYQHLFIFSSVIYETTNKFSNHDLINQYGRLHNRRQEKRNQGNVPGRDGDNGIKEYRTPCLSHTFSGRQGVSFP